MLTPDNPFRLVLPVLYGITVVAGAIGEWAYYPLGSVLELGLLAMIVLLAWRWPRQSSVAVKTAEASV